MFHKLAITLFFLLSAHSAIYAAPIKSTTAHVDGVLGTSFDITLYGEDTTTSHQAISSLLVYIDTLEGILSTWKNHSEISKLNLIKSSPKMSPTLTKIITLCQQWEIKSTQNFSCRLGQLKKRWQEAVNKQIVPDRIALRRLARDISKLPHTNLTSTANITVPKLVTYDVSGVAKGYILDQSIEFLKKNAPNLSGIMLNIGGDIIVWGNRDDQASWKIAIAPHYEKNNEATAHLIAIKAGAIAHSGVGERDFVIDRRRFSHILTPQEGWPKDTPHTATVFAHNGATADAVATALNAMDISDAISWVNTLPNVEAFIQTDSGAVYSTQNWHQLSPYVSKNGERTMLTLDYQIPKFDASTYERPYVSIWLTDTDNKFVRQLLLFGESNRWAQENKRWWRTIGRKDDSVLDALATPTRRPGHYQVTWNGFDHNNRPVDNKHLILHMEASREHGGHDYRKTKISLSNSTSINLPTKGELGQAVVTID